jgi:quinohemoprotein ethanol dehydrogenase
MARWTAILTIGIAPLLLGAIAIPAVQSGDWRSYGLDSSEQRFSPLTQIDARTVKQLGLAWSMDLPLNARGLQATPLAIDGTLYFSTSLSIVYAVDAVSGRELWRYDPEVGKYNPRSLRISLGVNRGVAYGEGLIFVGTLDGRLAALDAASGKPKWIVNTIEEVNARKQITGAPRVFNGKVIIGNAGADFGTRGYVTAYDIKTGKKVWRFYTVPGDPSKGFEDETQAMAAKTWGGKWWQWGGGGTAWNGLTFDKELNRIYVGTGNSSNYNPEQRSPGGGDNLFLASIVALDADTGKYIWHYQVNPREAWDFKATADMILADLNIAGKRHKVLMQAPTNGFFYVLDRESGKLLSAEKLGKVTWAERIDLKTGRPVEAPNIRYQQGPVTFWPSPWGIHDWQAMSFNPKLGLAFIPTIKLAGTYQTTPELQEKAKALVLGAKHYTYAFGATYAPTKSDPDDGTGGLVAWDPVQQKPRWTVKYASAWNGGTLTTASNLVFQGTADGWLHAYDATNGHELWRYYANNGIIAPPITYSVKGDQYITILVSYINFMPYTPDEGWRYGKHVPRVLTFKLGGTAKLPATPPPSYVVNAVKDPTPLDLAMARRGEALFDESCVTCHGVAGAIQGASAPDLRESAAARDLDTLRTIVHDGALSLGGMPQFDEYGDDQLRDISMYIQYVSHNIGAPPLGKSIWQTKSPNSAPAAK